MFGKKKMRLREKFEREFNLFPEQYEDNEIQRFRIEDIRLHYDMLHSDEDSQYLDEHTWNELSMDDIFLHLNHTRSFLGEQILYKNLRCLENSVEEEHIRIFEEDAETRLCAENSLHNIGKDGNGYQLSFVLSHMEIWNLKHEWLYRALAGAFIVLLLAGVIMSNQYMIAAAVVLGIINVSVNILVRNQYEQFAYSLKHVKSIIGTAANICDLEGLKEQEDIQKMSILANGMKKTAKKILQFQMKRESSIGADLASIIWDYLSGAFLYDVLTLCTVIRTLQNRNEDMLTLFEFVGQIDMEIAIASYRNNLESWCPATYTDSNELVAKEVLHPLLNKGVANDVHIQNRMVLTGSNASGKSTFMKAIATNCILAQTIHTAAAKEFRIPANLWVMSCMAIADDILSGSSYFVSELERIQDMLEVADTKSPVLLLFDELLRGTGYEERIAISEAVLHKIIETDAIVIIATHDLQLVNLIKDQYDSYYFESVVKDKMVTFDYLLHKGINRNKNAVELLDVLDYDPEIIARAKKNVSDYTG